FPSYGISISRGQQTVGRTSMRRWLIPLAAALMLASAQPVLAAQVKPGVVRTIADTDNPSCHNPEGIAASPDGLLYAAGLSGNICVYTRSGDRVRVIPVAAGHALLGELYVAGQIYVADNNGDFSGARIDRVDAASGAVTILPATFANTNAFAMDRRRRRFAFDTEGNLWVCANQANEIQVLSPSARLTARFSGNGANALDFPASPVFYGQALYIASLAFATAPRGGEISVLGTSVEGAPLVPRGEDD